MFICANDNYPSDKSVAIYVLVAYFLKIIYGNKKPQPHPVSIIDFAWPISPHSSNCIIRGDVND